MNPKQIYKIGDRVYIAYVTGEQRKISCPVCDGTLEVTVLFHDGTTVNVECGFCSHGYEGPRGYILSGHIEVSRVLLDVITGVDQRVYDGQLDITYWFGGNGYHDDRVHHDYDTALKMAEESIRMRNVEMDNEIETRKFNSLRSYAWNAKYHLDAAKKAQKDLEYHQRKARIMQERIPKRKE